MTNLITIPELKNLLPPLSKKEYDGLEKDILKSGCLSAIVTWNDTIVDGHNRYEICQKHGIPFDVKQMEFETLEDAKFWAWEHQEHRRNLTPYQRTELALKFKPQIEKRARERQRGQKQSIHINDPSQHDSRSGWLYQRSVRLHRNRIVRVSSRIWLVQHWHR